MRLEQVYTRPTLNKGRGMGRSRLHMRQMARICGAALIAILPACMAEKPTRKTDPEPRPDATAPELFEYVRSALLLLTPEDGVNDNLEVTFNWNTNVMTIWQPSGHCDLYMNALNANE